jgi:hypothetical protein
VSASTISTAYPDSWDVKIFLNLAIFKQKRRLKASSIIIKYAYSFSFELSVVVLADSSFFSDSPFLDDRLNDPEAER